MSRTTKLTCPLCDAYDDLEARTFSVLIVHILHYHTEYTNTAEDRIRSFVLNGFDLSVATQLARKGLRKKYHTKAKNFLRTYQLNPKVLRSLISEYGIINIHKNI